MDTLGLVVVAGLVVLAGYALAIASRRVERDQGPLPLYGMLRRRGAKPLDLPELALAARRCAFCGHVEDCRGRIATGAPAPADCPNAEYLARFSRPAA